MCKTIICEHLPDKGQRIKTRGIQSTAISVLEEHADLSSFSLLSQVPPLTEEGDRRGTGLSSEQRQETVNEETHLQQHIAAGNL